VVLQVPPAKTFPMLVFSWEIGIGHFLMTLEQVGFDKIYCHVALILDPLTC
jgi:hypothetical protein